MGAEEATRFLEALKTDVNLQQKLAAAVEGAEDRLQAIASVALGHGYRFSEEDLRAAVEQMPRELTDDELEHVAGGTTALGGAVFRPLFTKLD